MSSTKRTYALGGLVDITVSNHSDTFDLRVSIPKKFLKQGYYRKKNKFADFDLRFINQEGAIPSSIVVKKRGISYVRRKDGRKVLEDIEVQVTGKRYTGTIVLHPRLYINSHERHELETS